MSKQIQKRLSKEYANFMKGPVPSTGIQPREDDITVWDCAIQLEIEDTSGLKRNCLMPFVVKFPEEYPSKAPDVGFNIKFNYTDGASHFIDRPGTDLHGKFTVCIDLLGNYAHVHTEWADAKSSGWSPAYTISTLLVNLQSVLLTSIASSSSAHNMKLLQDCTEFSMRFPELIPEIHNSKEKVPEAQEIAKDVASTGLEEEKSRELVARKDEIPQIVLDKCSTFLSSLQLQEQRDEFKRIVDFFIHGTPVDNSPEAPNTSTDAHGCKVSEAVAVDDSISCWFTQSNYTEDVLGYGLKCEAKPQNPRFPAPIEYSITTDGELISKGAFDGGLREYPTKEKFSHFMPAWINPGHSSANPLWIAAMKSSLHAIGSKIGCKNYQEAARRLFPEIINTMVVTIMDTSSDVRASEKVFRCIVNLWRCYYYLTTVFPDLKSSLIHDTNSFIADESKRRKSVCPNIGWTLVNCSVLSVDEVNWAEFLRAFNEESFLRRVLWWQKSDVPITARDTFAHSEISYKISIFQTTFRRVVIGHDLADTIAAIDCSNAQVPDRLMALLDDWKLVLGRFRRNPSWIQYYDELSFNGLPGDTRDAHTADIEGHLQNSVRKAKTLQGYHKYQGGAGSWR